jgi:sporulation protein YqfC
LKKMRGVPKRILKQLEMAPEAAGSVRLTALDDTHVCIENYKTVLEYTQKRVKLVAGDFVIVLEGEGLELEAMGRENVAVRGQIGALRYEKL